jgi:hypothetical protein
LLAVLSLSCTTLVRAQGAQPATKSNATPQITAVTVVEQPTAAGASNSALTGFLLVANGSDLGSIAQDTSRVVLFPSIGQGKVTKITASTDNTMTMVEFTAPASYKVDQLALPLPAGGFITFDNSSPCDINQNVIAQPQVVRSNESKSKYGNGIAANFHVIQVSIVNKCQMPIIVPLAGMTVIVDAKPPTHSANLPMFSAGGTIATGTACKPGTPDCNTLVPLSLDHVTSLYSTDRKLTGARAVYFNILQAAATLGSAVQPFFGPGFTQGVAILGGGFTTASKEIFVDMSADQLQNLTSQSFNATEQISSGGALQKFIFVQRVPDGWWPHKKKQDPNEDSLLSGKFSLSLGVIPLSSHTPGSTTASGTPAKSKS